MKTKLITVSNNPNLNFEECPLNLSVFPNYMGINLCSIKSVEWVEQDDGQLKTLTVNFIPEPEE